jgi:hypothetical protein
LREIEIRWVLLTIMYSWLSPPGKMVAPSPRSSYVPIRQRREIWGNFYNSLILWMFVSALPTNSWGDFMRSLHHHALLFSPLI